MAKKVTKTTATSTEQTASGAAPAKKKASASRPKHLKAQAVAVAAAVEGFVQSLGASTAHHVEKAVEIEQDQAPETIEAVAEPAAPEVSSPVIKEEAPLEEQAQIAPEVSHAEISALAYRFYLERGGQNGSQADDWFRAEQALRSGRAE